MGKDYSYATLVGRPIMGGSATAPPPVPQLSVTGQGPQQPDSSAQGARSMLNWRDSPAVWFLVLLFAAAGVARASRIVT